MFLEAPDVPWGCVGNNELGVHRVRLLLMKRVTPSSSKITIPAANWFMLTKFKYQVQVQAGPL